MDQTTWVFGDVHGAFKALQQIFERAPIKKGDRIVSLGDIADGWSEVYECVNLLLQMQKDYEMIFIKGNHDDEFLHWLTLGTHKWNWQQGAYATALSYIKHAEREDLYCHPDMGAYKCNMTYLDVPEEHRKFFEKQHHIFIDGYRRVFVHGGFNRHISWSAQNRTILYWDRDLWMAALSYEGMKDKKHSFKMHENPSVVFIGHTATSNWGTDKPMKAANIWNLDTGAGFNGKLTIMNADTFEYYQSDPVQELYSDERGRN